DTGFSDQTLPLMSTTDQAAVPVNRMRPLDFDRDGDLDLIATRGLDAVGLVLFENLGGLRFEMRTDVGPAVAHLVDLEVGNVDADPELEVFSNIHRSEPGSVQAFEIDAQGNVTVTATLAAWELYDVADVNQDGYDDVLVEVASGISLHRGSATGLLPAVGIAAVSSDGARLGDVDGDGDLDLLARTDGGSCTIHENLGGFNFGPGVVPPFFSQRELDVVDWDVDGIPDIVTRNRESIDLHRGTGAGFASFAPAERLYDNQGSGSWIYEFDRRFLFDDVDRDGDPDLVVVSIPFNELYDWSALLITNDQMGPAVGPQQIAPGEVVSSHGFSDLDGDGDLDAFQVRGSQTAVVLENVLVPRSGVTICDAATENSSGRLGRLDVYGAPTPGGAPLRLLASGLPENQFGIFVGGPNAAPPTAIPGSMGTICLGANLGRYQRMDEIGFTGAAGSFELRIGTDDLRSGGVIVPAVAGLDWTFQAWHRDFGAGGPTNNLTSAVTVTFE
ncbi:MAG: FG-GAP-like repeat-containing protein, partial [Planctomycetota bacterium]